MPKASLRSDKALVAGGGIQEGRLEVVDSRFKLVQYTKGDGTQITPMFVFQLDVVRLNDGWDRIDPDETPTTQDFKVCWGSKELDENGLHTFRCHPGNAQSGTDSEPEDLGVEIGTEGNTIYIEDASKLPFADEPALVFMRALEAKGWKPEINDQAYGPNYVGLKFQIVTVPFAEACKRLSIKHKPNEKDQPIWVVEHIQVRPYEKTSGASKGKSAPAPVKGASTTTSSKPTPTVTKANGKGKDAEVDPRAKAEEVLKQFAESNAGEKMAVKAFRVKVGQALYSEHKIPPGPLNKAISELLKDDDVLAELANDIGFAYDSEAGQVVFADAQ